MSQNKNGIVKFLDEKFLISERGGSIRGEFFGGLTTFLTISYIIFVNPAVLSLTGMDKAALVTVTCVATAIGSFLGGVLGNVPISLAPGVGLNAFFTFTLVMGNGISWQDALGVVFFSGVFYLILAICGIREKIINSIPQQLSTAATVGIGLFLSLIGLKSMGIIEANPETLVKIAPITLPVALSLAGLFLMYILDMKKVKGGVLISIIVISIVGMCLGEVPMPEQLLSSPPSMKPLLFKLNVFGVMKVSLLGAIFSFMFIDLFDSLSVLMFTYKEVQFKNEAERKKGLGRMLLADCSSTIIGALLGTSTVTTYGESIAGIKVGAKTGLASIFTGLFFLLALFIAPIVEAIPVFAVAPALVIVGIFMFRNVAQLDLSTMKESIPAFMTIIFMPMTHSIAIGLSIGFISYIIINVACMDFKKISITMWVIGILSVINLLI